MSRILGQDDAAALRPDGAHGRRIRVVTLVDGIGLGGGAERIARQVTVGLDPERFDRTLCVTRWPDEREADEPTQVALEGLRSAGVGFLGLERSSVRDLPAWRPLLRMLRGERVDVMHSHGFGSNVWGAAVGSIARVPVLVAHEHTWSFEGQPMRRFLDRRVAGRVDAFLAVSEADRRRMIEIERIPAEKVTIVPNGITPPEVSGRRDLRAEYDIPADAPVVGTVCTLRPQKALDVLIDAAAELRTEFPDLRVLIVGDGDERDRLAEQIGRLGLERTVHLVGFSADAGGLMSCFDIAACSSDFEGSPLSILEYMEASLPVVSTNVGGVPDMIENGVHGLLVERRDPVNMAAALAELIRDPQGAKRMGSEGQRRRRELYDMSQTIDRISRIYEELVGAARTSRLDTRSSPGSRGSSASRS